MEEKNNELIIVELKKPSSIILPTIFEGDYFKEYHSLYYSDCKQDLMNNHKAVIGVGLYGK